MSEFTNDSENGKYILSLPAGKNYGIAVKSNGYLFHSENFDIPESAGFRAYEKIIYLKKIKKGESIVLRNIFFDLDKYSLKPESETELNRLINLLKQNPNIRIEISGHTDTRGSSKYNQILSVLRSESVKTYIINRGISFKRIETIGMGEIHPLAENVAADGSDNPTGRAANRRVEIQIIK